MEFMFNDSLEPDRHTSSWRQLTDFGEKFKSCKNMQKNQNLPALNTHSRFNQDFCGIQITL